MKSAVIPGKKPSGITHLHRIEKVHRIRDAGRAVSVTGSLNQPFLNIFPSWSFAGKTTFRGYSKGR